MFLKEFGIDYSSLPRSTIETVTVLNQPIAESRFILSIGCFADFDTRNKSFKMESDIVKFIQVCEAEKPRFGEDYEARLAQIRGQVHLHMFSNQLLI